MFSCTFAEDVLGPEGLLDPKRGPEGLDKAPKGLNGALTVFGSCAVDCTVSEDPKLLNFDSNGLFGLENRLELDSGVLFDGGGPAGVVDGLNAKLGVGLLIGVDAGVETELLVAVFEDPNKLVFPIADPPKKPDVWLWSGVGGSEALFEVPKLGNVREAFLVC